MLPLGMTMGLTRRGSAPAPPRVVSASIVGGALTFSFDRVMDFDDNPLTDEVSTFLNGDQPGTGAACTYVSGSGTKTFVFSGQTVLNTDVVSLVITNYSDGFGFEDPATGRYFTGVANFPVVNNTPPAPTFVSAAVDVTGLILTTVWSAAVNHSSGTITLTLNNGHGTRSATYRSGDGTNTILWTIAA